MSDSAGRGALRSTTFDVDLDILRSNYRALRAILDRGVGLPPERIGPWHLPRGGRVRMATVLKADAYGHGARAVARVLADEGADMIAVACLPEAVEARGACPDADVLVMGHTPERFFPEAVRNRITLTVYDAAQAALLSAAATAAGTKAVVHVKLDTGMNRLGMKPSDNPVETVAAMAELRGLEIGGVFTHLALRAPDTDRAQCGLFADTVRGIEERGVRVPVRHVCDSIGMLRHAEWRLDMVRVGASLFGVRPMRAAKEYDPFPFPMPGIFRTEIARLRMLKPEEMVSYDASWKAPEGGALVATLPVGYADGYPRRFSNRSQVVIRGRRAPVIGLVCMDQMMVDASAVEGVAEGDEVILYGGGEGGIGLMEASEWAGSNRNELLTTIGRRVPRRYFSGGRPAGTRDELTRPGAEGGWDL